MAYYGEMKCAACKKDVPVCFEEIPGGLDRYRFKCPFCPASVVHPTITRSSSKSFRAAFESITIREEAPTAFTPSEIVDVTALTSKNECHNHISESALVNGLSAAVTPILKASIVIM